MAASLDYPTQQFAVHRRPLPSAGVPAMDYLSHSRTRTVSSNVLPPQPYAQQPPPPPMNQSRRTLSNATTSTTSTASSLQHRTQPGPPSSYASSIRRSTSSRSNNTPSSYVALMRKQKATVWCDRAQHEDPRILAQQRAAKSRAQMEVVGGVSATGNGGRTAASSGGIASKIRHHGAVKASAYSAAGNLSGAGVPMRLSASEVDEDNSDDDSAIARYHQRNNSGRSSLGSGHRMRESYYAGTTPTVARFSNGSTPPSNNSYSPVERQPEPRDRQDSSATARSYSDATPMAGAPRTDYFNHPGGNGGSSGSIQEERQFGDVGGLPARAPLSYNYDQQKTNDELRRRGSVDDRTTTMSGVRLFVANPDMDDD